MDKTAFASKHLEPFGIITEAKWLPTPLTHQYSRKAMTSAKFPSFVRTENKERKYQD